MVDFEAICERVAAGIECCNEIPPRNERDTFVQNLAKTGRYLFPSEVSQVALPASRSEELHEWKTGKLRQEIRNGMDEIDKGLGTTVTVEEILDFMASLRRRALRKLKAQQQANRQRRWTTRRVDR